MSVYTIELHEAVEEILGGDYAQLFPAYNLFDDNHKQELELKIYNHYFFNEIGSETFEMFLHRFKTQFLEIIPLANKYFEMLADPSIIKLVNDTRTREYNIIKEGSSNAGKFSNDSSIDVNFKDTPYTQLANENLYATTKTGTHNSTSNDQVRDSRMNSKDEFTEEVSGLNGLTPAEAFGKYKAVIFDVDMYIINNLRDLFMGVF